MLDGVSPFFVVGLVVSLCVGVVTAYEMKSIEAGFRILFLFLGICAALWIFAYFAAGFLEGIIIYIFYVSYFLGVSVAGMVYEVNSKKGGELCVSEKIDPEEFNWLILFAMAVIFVAGFNAKVPVFSMALISLLVERKRKLYLSFQIRKNGFLSMGRYMPFEQIQFVHWEHQLRKGKLKMTLRTGQAFTVKVPWNLILPADDYVRKYQTPI